MVPISLMIVAIREKWVAEIICPNEEDPSQGQLLRVNLPKEHCSTWVYYLDLADRALRDSAELTTDTQESSSSGQPFLRKAS